ncbi:MAG: hypothetical protein CVV33_07800, partial [Methanomicrobiales archaeon HGW-Methanomicrobiales-4]
MQILTILAIVAGCVIIAGCTDKNLQSPVQTPDLTVTPLPITPLPTTPQTSEPTHTPSLFDQPVSEPPVDLYVSVSVQKDPIYSTITATFDGGKGQDLIQSIQVRTTLSTGNVSTRELGKKKGDVITIPGTKGVDRIQVGITYMNGLSYL